MMRRDNVESFELARATALARKLSAECHGMPMWCVLYALALMLAYLVDKQGAKADYTLTRVFDAVGMIRRGRKQKEQKDA